MHDPGVISVVYAIRGLQLGVFDMDSLIRTDRDRVSHRRRRRRNGRQLLARSLPLAHSFRVPVDGRCSRTNPSSSNTASNGHRVDRFGPAPPALALQRYADPRRELAVAPALLQGALAGVPQIVQDIDLHSLGDRERADVLLPPDVAVVEARPQVLCPEVVERLARGRRY